MKTHKFQINALCVITIVVPCAALLLIVIVGNASAVVAKDSDYNNNNSNNNNINSNNTIITIANVDHAHNGNIDYKATQTETETTTTKAMTTPRQGCNKFNKNPRTKNNNNNNVNGKENEINAIIKNDQRAGVRKGGAVNGSLISQSAASWSSVARYRNKAKASRNWPKWTDDGEEEGEKESEDGVAKNEKEDEDSNDVPIAGDGRKRSRAKRFLIFEGSGVVKFVVGVAFPVTLDKLRSVSVFYNLQSQYTPPPTPVYWWSLYNSTNYFMSRTLEHDASRSFVYEGLEQLLESKGLPGAPCLLRAICEVAERPIEGSTVFHALLNAIFTPSATNIDGRYLDAQAAGRGGADCAQTFSACPKNIDWLGRISP